MFIEWWNALDTMSHVFYCIAIPATLVLLIQTILMFIGIGNDSEGFGEDIADGDVDNIDYAESGIFGEDGVEETPAISGLEGRRIVTVRGIIAFFVVFGWVGVVMQETGVHFAVTLAVAFASGFAMMVALALLFKAVLKLRNDGNTDNRNAIGTSGKVYLTIPPARSGVGKVDIMLQGSYVERNAVTDDAEAIPTGAEIVVIGLSGQVDLIVRRK